MFRGRREVRTSKDYLKLLDGKLGYPQGTLFNLCVSAVKSKVETKDKITVTYRGVTTRQKHLSSRRFIQVRKSIFLIEFTMTKEGKQYDRVIQVHLEM